jgi:hypothetical protein
MRLFARTILMVAIVIGFGGVSLLAESPDEGSSSTKDNSKDWLFKAVQEQEKLKESNKLDTDKDLSKDTQSQGVEKDSGQSDTSEKKGDANGKTDMNGVKQTKDSNNTRFNTGTKAGMANDSGRPDANSPGKKPGNPSLAPLSPFSTFTTTGIHNLGNSNGTGTGNFNGNGPQNPPDLSRNDPAKLGLNFGQDLPKANPLLTLPDYQASKQPGTTQDNSGENYYGNSMNIKPVKASPTTAYSNNSDGYLKNMYDQQNQPQLAPKPMNMGNLYNQQLGHSMDSQPKPAQPLTLGLQPPRQQSIISRPVSGQTRVSDPNDFLNR